MSLLLHNSLLRSIICDLWFSSPLETKVCWIRLTKSSLSFILNCQNFIFLQLLQSMWFSNFNQIIDVLNICFKVKYLKLYSFCCNSKMVGHRTITFGIRVQVDKLTYVIRVHPDSLYTQLFSFCLSGCCTKDSMLVNEINIYISLEIH